MKEYAELHCQSVFSLLDGASTPERLVDVAKAYGYRALALTDFADLGGAVRFAEHAGHQELEAIIGIQVSTKIGHEQGRLVLLAETMKGYANLSSLVTHARIHSARGMPLVPWSMLQSYSEGVFCLTGGSRGGLYRSLSRQDQIGSKRILRDLYAVYADRLAIEVVHHGIPSEMECAREAISYAQDMQIPWVVTNDVRYADVCARTVYDTLQCLKAKTVISKAGDILHPNAEWALKSRSHLWTRWSELPDGLMESLRIAERCTFRLGMLEMPLPMTALPSDFKSADAYLKHLVLEGMHSRWGTLLTANHRAQIKREIELILKRELAGYFLIMWEIVSFAKRQSILVQGRGSAANSAVCYVLGITAVDPIAHDLLFERFLSDARDGYPDIDLDIEHARREEVIQFVYEKYGRDRAAMVCAHHCFRSRAAVRDVARVLEFEQGDIDRLASLAHRHGGLSTALLSDEKWQTSDVRIQSLVRISNELKGLPRQRATHSGGFVLSATPIGQSVPIEPAAMMGRTIVQWDKDDLDVMKIPKFDLLGLGILTAIAHGLRLVRERYQLPVYLYQLPQATEVYDMIGEADTIGLFQIESRAQMNSLPRTKPRSLYELAIQVALIRPGPLQGNMVHPYIRRRRGEEPVDLIHPLIAPILKRTLGVPLFQEQGMRLAVEVGGFSPTDAERLRRAISNARSRDKFPGLLRQLKSGMRANGVSTEASERLIQHIAAFSTYGFPESHSTSFALLVYASAWIKRFYPAEYLTALLRSQPLGFYAPDTLISDAQRHGVNVTAPCLKRSRWCTELIGNEVILGLRWIRGLGPRARRSLEMARKAGEFNALHDVFRRCELPKEAWLTLVRADAFRSLVSGDRRRAAWVVLRQLATRQLSLPLQSRPEERVRLEPLSKLDEMEHDYASMQLSAGSHPMSFYRPTLSKRVIASKDLKSHGHGRWVQIAGIIISRQRPETAKGFCFVSLEDEYGFMNVIVSPQRFERYWKHIVRARALLVSGNLSLEQDVCNIKALHIEPLVLKGLAHLPASYDFR